MSRVLTLVCCLSLLAALGCSGGSQAPEQAAQATAVPEVFEDDFEAGDTEEWTEEAQAGEEPAEEQPAAQDDTQPEQSDS